MTDNNQSYLPIALNNGLIYGGLAMVASLLSHVTGLQANPWSSALMAIVLIALYYLAASKTIKQHRDGNLGGFISLGEAFVAALITCLAIAFLSSVFHYIYINFIDDSGIKAGVDMSIELLERLGMDEDQLDQLNRDDMVAQQKSILTVLMALIVNGGVFGSIVAIIAGAIHQRKPISA